MVMWINKDRAEEGRRRRDTETWPEVFDAAKKLKAAGHATCGFSNGLGDMGETSSSFSAWHNAAIGTKANGLDGFDTVSELQRTAAGQAPAEPDRSAEGQDLRLFRPRQRQRKPLRLRRVRDLPDLVGLLRDRESTAKFDFTSAPMPYYPDAAGAPQNSIIGGASLWVMGGKKPEEYKVSRSSSAFLSTPTARPAASGIRLPADHQGGL